MEQILFAYGLSKETVTVIIMLYKNTKAIVCSTDTFDIAAGVLQGDRYITTICIYTSKINRSNKRKLFHIKKR